MQNRFRQLIIALSLAAAPLAAAQEQAAPQAQGKVIAVSGSNVVIGAGSSTGIRGGEKLLVTTPWEIIHSNGKKTWKGEREVGFLRVVAVGEDQSLADLISGSVNKGDNVRVLAGLTEQVASGEETSQRLNAWINAYNSGSVDQWMDFLAEDVQWVNPDAVLHGKAEIWSDAEKKELDRTRFVESRRIVYGDSVAWEGTWEATDPSSGAEVKRPTVLMIDFNEQGKIKRLSSYYDLKK